MTRWIGSESCGDTRISAGFGTEHFIIVLSWEPVYTYDLKSKPESVNSDKRHQKLKN